MSLQITGFKPADKEYKKKQKAWQACVDAEVEPPEELNEYFNYEAPDPAGMEVDIEFCLAKRKVSMQDGFDIDLSKVPNDVKIIRVYYAY